MFVFFSQKGKILFCFFLYGIIRLNRELIDDLSPRDLLPCLRPSLPALPADGYLDQVC